MTMSRREIAAVVDSIRTVALGGWIQKIYQTDDLSVALDVRAPGRSVWLIVSCAPRFSRIGLLDRKPETTASPPRFCQALRKHWEGKVIVALESDPVDRIVRLTARGREVENRLVGELFGWNGNLILLDSEDLVIEAAKRTENPRPIHSGVLYAPPPSASGSDDKPIRDFGEGDIAFAATSYYENRIAEFVRVELEQKLLRTVEKQKKRSGDYLQKLRAELAALPDPVDVQRLADHLAAHLREAHRGASRLDVPDFFGEGIVSIPLDPALTAPQNMEKLYRRARRDRRKKESLAGRIDEIEKHVNKLSDFEKIAAEASGDLEKLREAEKRFAAEGLLPPPRKERAAGGKVTPKQNSGPRRFTSIDGSEILVGRSAQENDEITFRVARGNDWWFHVVGFPSSHVVARARPDGSIDRETVIDAASLALLNSKLSRQGSGEVMYTQRKYVRKPKDAAPGKVIAENTKTVFVRIDQERVRRLYKAP